MDGTIVIINHPNKRVSREIAGALLESQDSGIIGEYGDAADFKQTVITQSPDILISSIGDKSYLNFDTARYLRRHLPSLKIIVVVDSENAAGMVMAMKAGAAACVPETAPPALWKAILTELDDGRWPIIDELLRPEVANLVLADFEAPSPLRDLQNDILTKLLPPETEMLLGIAAGNGIEYSRSDIELINKQLRAVVHKLMSNNDVTLLLAEYTKITAG